MASVGDGRFYEPMTVTGFFGCDAMRRLFGEDGLMQAWLDVEAALARAQARLGIIPEDAARTITAAARLDELDRDAIAAHVATTRHPIVPLIRALVARCGSPAGDHVHLGATTQDIMDTGYVLQARAGLAIVDDQVCALAAILRRLAAQYRDTAMAGRTHGQQALPTTFGLRAAGWYDELRRHRARLKEMRPRLLVGSFGGAAGTLAGYGPRALELRAEVMRELGLGVPATSWHANLDRFAECVAFLGMIASTGEKLAREIYLLGRTEIGELAEPQGTGQVGSSTMPHKANPIRCEAIIAAAATLRAQVPVALGAMVAQDDRDMGAGMALWKLIPEAFILTGGILERLVDIMDNLPVDPERMTANLHLTGGLIVSEAVMLRLAGQIGREAAHHAVTDAVKAAAETGRGFAECLAAHDAIAGRLGAAEIAALLDPEAYVGAAAAIVDAVLAEGEEDD